MSFSFLSVCSGIEAASVAFAPLGWSAVGFAEIEAFPSAVLARHYGSNMPGEPITGNGVPNFGDFTKIALLPPIVDVLCGGTPCQSFSVAGKRMSLSDARGNLTLAFVVLAHELAESHGLRNALWENVPGALSTKDNAFGCFLGAFVGGDGPVEPVTKPAKGKSNKFWRWRDAGTELDDDGNTVEVEEGHYTRWPSLGMVAGPLGRAAWRVFDAQYFGLAQRRARLFVVYDPGNGADPAAVLFEQQGMYRDSPPSREAGQRVAGTLSARTEGGGGLGTDFDLSRGLTAARMVAFGEYEVDGTASTLKQRDYKDATYLIAHTLRGDGFDASEDGTGRGTPIVPVVAPTLVSNGDAHSGYRDENGLVSMAFAHAFDARQSDVIQYGNMAGPLDTDGHSQAVAFQDRFRGDDGRGYDRPPAVSIEQTGTLETVKPWAVAYDLRGREDGAQFEGPHDTANIRAASGGSSRSYVAAHESGPGWWSEGDVAGCLRAEGENRPSRPSNIIAESRWAVRRLTPKECERLQGFPDDYTRIPWRGKADGECPDGPRYKALGNSWAVPVVRWIASRIDAELKAIG